MSELARIRAQYDRAVDAETPDPWLECGHTSECCPEGLGTIRAARILYEQWEAEQRVLVEAAAPKAA